MDEGLQGTITISTMVLNTIARLTTLNVPGVARMGNNGQSAADQQRHHRKSRQRQGQGRHLYCRPF